MLGLKSGKVILSPLKVWSIWAYVRQSWGRPTSSWIRPRRSWTMSI